MNIQATLHLVWIIPLSLLVVYIGSPRFLGTMAPAQVRRILTAALEKNRYTVFHDLLLPSGGGTTHIDHLVVSRFGVFVIESIYRRGVIEGNEVQDRWKQRLRRTTRRFDNPVQVNFLKIQSLERLLDMPLSRFQGLVVICGCEKLKPGSPSNVIGIDQLTHRIRAASRERLSAVEADSVVRKIYASKLPSAYQPRRWKWRLLRLVLFGVLVAGVYVVYQSAIHSIFSTIQQHADQRMAPENFHPDGTLKSQHELWQDSLTCAASVDSGRCACYDPGGSRVQINDAECRELASRGSILNQ